MNINITNQKPSDLGFIVNDAINKDFDAPQLIQETLIDPVTQGLNPTKPVQIKIDGVMITENDIIDLWLSCCQDTVDIQSEDTIKAVYSKMLIHYTKPSNLSAKRILAIQSGNMAKLPEPSATIIYTPAVDIIPTARKFLASQAGYHEWFAVLAYYANPQVLGFYFADESAFDEFKTYFASEVAQLSTALSIETVQLCTDFQNLKLDGLTESLLLRNDDDENNHPFSFARLLVNRLMDYTTKVSNTQFSVLPFDIGELICPKSVVFVNIDKHAKATNRQVAEEWKLINQSVASKPSMVSLNQLTKLTAMQRNLKKIASLAANAMTNKNYAAIRAKQVAFKRTPPNTFDMARLIKKIMDKMAFVNKSMNTYRKVKTTFARPNRREPDNFNKQGKMVSTKYKPDIHLYIDTSGSISEENYQDAVKACITMAKKLNVNLYFNSFSHMLSQCAKLHTKDKSVSAIYKEFQRLPKVTGGTNYDNIWQYIMESKERQREISILMTDFEYDVPNKHIDHPKNLYYMPMSHMDWDRMVHFAKQFSKSFIGQVPDIRNHILF